MKTKQKLTEREIEEDIFFLDSANMAWVDNLEGANEAQILIGMIMEKFKFGYSGNNGWFKDRSELEAQISDFIANAR